MSALQLVIWLIAVRLNVFYSVQPQLSESESEIFNLIPEGKMLVLKLLPFKVQKYAEKK